MNALIKWYWWSQAQIPETFSATPQPLDWLTNQRLSKMTPFIIIDFLKKILNYPRCQTSKSIFFFYFFFSPFCLYYHFIYHFFPSPNIACIFWYVSRSIYAWNLTLGHLISLSIISTSYLMSNNQINQRHTTVKNAND